MPETENPTDFASRLCNSKVGIDMAFENVVRLWTGPRTETGYPLVAEQFFKSDDLRELAAWLVGIADRLDGKQLAVKPKRARKTNKV